jgi:porin
VANDDSLSCSGKGAIQGLGSFGTFLYSLDDKANQMDYYFSVGFVYTGLLPRRTRDKTGLAFSKGWFSDELKTPRRAAGLPIKHHEAVLELNHKFELGRGIDFQPDIQYVIDPTGNKEINEALLVGAKIAIQF